MGGPTMQREAVLTDVVHRGVGHRRQDGFLTVYIVIPRGFVEMLASNGGEKLTDFLQLCRMGVQTVSQLLKNALDAGEMRTFRLYSLSTFVCKAVGFFS